MASMSAHDVFVAIDRGPSGVPSLRRRVPRGCDFAAVSRMSIQQAKIFSPFGWLITSMYPSPSCLIGTGTHCMFFISRVRLFSYSEDQSFTL